MASLLLDCEQCKNFSIKKGCYSLTSISCLFDSARGPDAMRLFRRSTSSGSSSSQSTPHSASSNTTPRTNTENEHQRDVAECGAKPEGSQSTFFRLPVELIQQIAGHLDPPSAAAFCLSSRFVCYAVGTDHLSRYIESSKSRFEKRRTIETVVERAFPGHWFCAWCDAFHAWKADQVGPKETASEKQRDCAEFNSYLHDGPDYVICHHHVRLAVNSKLWGPEHGIPLSRIAHAKSSMAKISKTPVPTQLDCDARIVQGHLILQSKWAVLLPMHSTKSRTLLHDIWDALPHIVAGHRDSDNGHTGLMAAIDNAVRRGWKYPFTQCCGMCATDWTVSAHDFHHATGGQVRLVVTTWRDLGTGRNPFETSWRAHGVSTHRQASTVTNVIRMTQTRAGEIRRAYESAIGEISSLASRAGQERSRSRPRIYRSYLRKESDDGIDVAVVRSRAKTQSWRTRAANNELLWQEDKRRLEMSRHAEESFLRIEAQHANVP